MPQWWQPAALLLVIIALVALGLALDSCAEGRCEDKGGEYTRHGRGGLCLKPGSVIR